MSSQLIVVLRAPTTRPPAVISLIAAGVVSPVTSGTTTVAGPGSDGRAPIEPSRLRCGCRRFRDSGLRPVKGPLTRREWEVIDLLAAGHSPDRVANTLVHSPETVRPHIKNLMRKLRVHSRADAVDAAERLRLTGRTPPTDTARLLG